MMNFVIMGVFSISLLVVCIIAMNYNSVVEKRNILIIPQMLKEGTVKLKLFLAAMVVSELFFAIWLEYLYSANSIVKNMKLLMLISVLWIAAYYDIKEYIIPNKLILLGIVYRLIMLVVEFFIVRDDLLNILKSDGVAVLFIVIVCFINLIIVKDGIGMGDIKLFIVIAVTAGVDGMIVILLASLLCAFFVSMYLLLFKKKKKSDVIPFAPCILFGAMLAIALTGL